MVWNIKNVAIAPIRRPLSDGLTNWSVTSEVLAIRYNCPQSRN